MPECNCIHGNIFDFLKMTYLLFFFFRFSKSMPIHSTKASRVKGYVSSYKFLEPKQGRHVELKSAVAGVRTYVWSTKRRLILDLSWKIFFFVISTLEENIVHSVPSYKERCKILTSLVP